VLRRLPEAGQRMAMLKIERRFARQARILVLVTGLSGLYMLVQLQAWDRFTSLSCWWIHAMVLVWLIFAAMLVLVEPLVLHRRSAARAKAEPDAALRAMHRLHWGLLALSLLTIVGVVAGSHGLLLFE
jgi:hypothetical protein